MLNLHVKANANTIAYANINAHAKFIANSHAHANATAFAIVIAELVGLGKFIKLLL